MLSRFKLTKTHYLLIILQVLALVTGLIHLENKNWPGVGIALGLFIVLIPNKANIQLYSVGISNAFKKQKKNSSNRGIEMKLRYFGISVLLVSFLLDVLF